RSDGRRELAAVREGLELSSLRTRQPTDVSAGEAYRLLQHDVEHGLEVEGRAADGLEYLTDRGLPLEGLLRLVEEANVLDRDRGLRGERLDELDLPRGERTCLAPAQADHSERRALQKYG